MLKLTKKIEYALIAIRYIRKKGENQVASAKEISDVFQIPSELLAKVLQQLARIEILSAVQGPRGGYKLRAALSSVNLTDFIEAVEGPIGIAECSVSDICDQLDQCNIRVPLKKINDNLRAVLDNVTLEELAC